MELLAFALDAYVAEHGSLPYSATRGRFCDPYRLGRLDEWGMHYCPELSVEEGGTLQDSGYRMPNLPEAEWTRLFNVVRRGAGDGERECVVPSLGLPLFWCSKPIHAGKRNVLILPLDEGPLVLRRLRLSGSIEHVDEATFGEMLGALERLLEPVERGKPPKPSEDGEGTSPALPPSR